MPAEIPSDVRTHLREGETVIAWTRPSPLSLTGPLLVLVGVLVLTVVVAVLTQTPGLEQLAPAATLAVVLVIEAGRKVFGRVRSVYFTAYTLTDRRLLATSTLIRRQTTTVPLAQVSTVQQRRGPVSVLVGLDTLVVSAYGDRGTSIEIPGMAQAGPMRSRLARATVDTASPRWLLRGD